MSVRLFRRPDRALFAATSLCTVLLASACGSAGSQESDDPTASSASTSATITNCGEEASYTVPATAIVATSNSANIGTLLKIGAVDQLAAVSMTKGNDAVMSELYGPGIADVPRLKSPISLESIVATEPDLLIGSYSGLFSGSSGVTPEAAKDKGIATYVISDSCRQDPSAGASSKLGTMDPWEAVHADLANYGTLTGHEDEAAKASDELDRRLAALKAAPQAEKAPRVLLFDSGTTDVYTSGRNGPPQGILTAAGAENVFASEDTTWFKASWESVATQKPDVIVVMDYKSDTPDEVEQKLATIRSQAALKDTDAVKQNRIIVLPLTLFTSGYPNIEAAEQVRVGLERLGLQPASGITPALDLS